MAARLEGTLAADVQHGVVVLVGDQPTPVIWPLGYQLREGAAGLELLTAEGEVLAREGEGIEVGGGEPVDGSGWWLACDPSRPETWAMDCGEVDAELCREVMKAVLSVLPFGAGTPSVWLGAPVCLQEPCVPLAGPDSLVGATVELVGRPWPLLLNCGTMPGSELMHCAAAARMLTGTPDIGVPYSVSTYTHCGLRAIEFDGDRWAIAGILDDGNANPPPRFGNPTDAGTVTLLSVDEGLYRSQYGEERRITRGGGLPDVEGCL